MKETRLIDVQALQKEAKNSEHKESYRILERSRNYRIGVGSRLASYGQPSFFVEVLVYLCSDSSEVDLHLLEKKLMLLRELRSRGYSLSCQDDGTISCETNVPLHNLDTECETIKSITKKKGLRAKIAAEPPNTHKSLLLNGK